MFDGRLDNRAELIAALSIKALPDDPLSDTQIVLHAYQAWGEKCTERLLGPVAFVIYDVQKHTILCNRDALGTRTVLLW